jgi:hypothetical protein
MSKTIIPTIDDTAARTLAGRLRLSASEVTEPERSRILETLPNTLFISHTSVDDALIKGVEERETFPRPESIWSICGERFHDPFYHSLGTGGANSYERMVGLALLASTRVLVIWTVNALRSDYVRAELLIATQNNKKLAAYVVAGAPNMPLTDIPLIYDQQALRSFLRSW